MTPRSREYDTMARGQFSPEEQALGGSQGEMCDGQNCRANSIVANPPVVWRLQYPLCNGIIFAGQSKAERGQSNHKDLQDVRIMNRMVRERRQNRKKQMFLI